MSELNAFLKSTSASPGEADPKLIALFSQSEQLVELMNSFFAKLDKGRSQDFLDIANHIAEAKEDIRNLRPMDISTNGIPTAGAELNAITQDTEGATNAILSSAEAILGMDASTPGLKDKVDDEIMKIFEACSFQDLTGQRVSKIVKVLSQIEERISRLADSIGDGERTASARKDELSIEEKRRRDLLLNGPAIGGPETHQSEIDDMFA